MKPKVISKADYEEAIKELSKYFSKKVVLVNPSTGDKTRGTLPAV